MQSDETKPGTLRFRKLRIAWSVFSGVACVLLIVFWVRSYTWADQSAVRVSPTHHILFGSQLGAIWCSLVDSPRVVRTHVLVDSLYAERPKRPILGTFGLYHGEYGFTVPHGFLALATGIVATIPWKPWKFSLRTLLIATTLVAVVLGLAVWLSRS